MNLNDFIIQITEIISMISNFAGAIGGLVSAFGVCKMLHTQRKMLERVKIQLKLEGEGSTAELPLEMLRRDISRAEVLGRLGMVLKSQGQRFSLKALTSPLFMKDVNRVVQGKTSTLTIPCTREEMDQFEIG